MSASWRLRDNPDMRLCKLCHQFVGVGLWHDARAAWLCIACASDIHRAYPEIARAVSQQAHGALAARHALSKEGRT